MSANTIGRNAPCPCGSGKKYKHCCMRQGRQRHPARAQQPPSAQEQLDQALSMGREALRRAPPDQAKEIQRLVDAAEEAIAYSDMQAEIDAAMRTLETHRAEFVRLMADSTAGMAQAEKLFSEERFQSMRYTVADVQRAFEAVGYPSRYDDKPGKEVMETLVAAAVHLAGDESQRLHLSRRLMMLLPEYVAAGRYLDAWLIQYSAYRLVETPHESSPFMFTMFNLAFTEWTRKIAEQREDLLRQLGIDKSRLEQMSVEEAEIWLKEQLADPEKESRLEACYQAHLMLREQTQAEAAELWDDAILLLERDDADCLYLSPDELKPWLLTLRERAAGQETLLRQARERGESPDPATIQAMQTQFVELTQEMAAVIFTPERLAQLVADLKDYRRRMDRMREKKAALYIYMVLKELEREESPAETRFLLALCFVSLREMIKALAEQGQAAAKEETANSTGVES